MKNLISPLLYFLMVTEMAEDFLERLKKERKREIEETLKGLPVEFTSEQVRERFFEEVIQDPRKLQFLIRFCGRYPEKIVFEPDGFLLPPRKEIEENTIYYPMSYFERHSVEEMYYTLLHEHLHDLQIEVLPEWIIRPEFPVPEEPLELSAFYYKFLGIIFDVLQYIKNIHADFVMSKRLMADDKELFEAGRKKLYAEAFEKLLFEEGERTLADLLELLYYSVMAEREEEAERWITENLPAFKWFAKTIICEFNKVKKETEPLQFAVLKIISAIASFSYKRSY